MSEPIAAPTDVRAADDSNAAAPTPRSYPPEAILTPAQAAAWLGVSVKTLETLPIRRRKVGHRTVRYLGRWILEFMEVQ